MAITRTIHRIVDRECCAIVKDILANTMHCAVSSGCRTTGNTGHSAKETHTDHRWEERNRAASSPTWVKINLLANFRWSTHAPTPSAKGRIASNTMGV